MIDININRTSGDPSYLPMTELEIAPRQARGPEKLVNKGGGGKSGGAAFPTPTSRQDDPGGRACRGQNDIS